MASAIADGQGTVGNATLDRRRWLVLFAMLCVGMMQCLGWMTFSGSPMIAEQIYQFEAAQAEIDFLLNLGPIMYLFVAPLIALGTSGKSSDRAVWWLVLLGASLTALGMLMRLAPSLWPALVPPESPAAHLILTIGQALNGAAGPMNCATPSLIAAIWFPPQERTFATSAIFACQMAGPSLGFLLALGVTSDAAFDLLMYGEAVCAVAALLIWGSLPHAPRVPPSASQSLRMSSATPHRRISWKRWMSIVALFVSGGTNVGMFQSWAPALPTQLEGTLPRELLKWLSLAASGASFAGSLAAGPLAEGIGMQRHLKRLIVLAMLVELFCLTGFSLLMPDAPVTLGPAGSMRAYGHLLFPLLLIGSFVEGVVSPWIFELGAELTYPYSESMSGAAYSWLVNAAGMVMLVVLPAVPTAYDSFLMVVGCFAALAAMSLVHEEYPRRVADDCPQCTAAQLLREGGAPLFQSS